MAILVSSSPELDAAEAQLNGELSIILTEYELQQQKFASSIDNVNQSLTLYLGLVALLAPLAGIGLGAWSPNNKTVSLGIAFLALVLALATAFTLFRSYQARILQTDAEKSLSRLRHYFVAKYPDVRLYLTGPTYDDWPTPYTNRRSSLSYWGWMVLVVGAGFFAAVTVAAFTFALDYPPLVTIWWVTSVIVGSAVSWLCYRWLDHKLTERALSDVPKFPKAINRNPGTTD